MRGKEVRVYIPVGTLGGHLSAASDDVVAARIEVEKLDSVTGRQRAIYNLGTLISGVQTRYRTSNTKRIRGFERDKHFTYVGATEIDG